MNSALDFTIANQKGQALIETVFCFTLISSLLCFFGAIILIGSTNIILDNETDELVLCLASYEKQNCKGKSLKSIQKKLPWLKIESYREKVSFMGTGYKQVNLTLTAKGELKWLPLKLQVNRSFNEEKMKRASRY